MLRSPAHGHTGVLCIPGEKRDAELVLWELGQFKKGAEGSFQAKPLPAGYGGVRGRCAWKT